MTKYNTEQRKMLTELFRSSPHEMFSVKEIAEKLENEPISMSAIYRNVSELEASGVIRRCSKSGSRESYYQYTAMDDCREHIHLTCRKCGKTIHMAHEETDALIECASKYNHFTVDRTEMVLFGVCSGCSNK